jgi:hypothetical protein
VANPKIIFIGALLLDTRTLQRLPDSFSVKSQQPAKPQKRYLPGRGQMAQRPLADV